MPGKKKYKDRKKVKSKSKEDEGTPNPESQGLFQRSYNFFTSLFVQNEVKDDESQSSGSSDFESGDESLSEYTQVQETDVWNYGANQDGDVSSRVQPESNQNFSSVSYQGDGEERYNLRSTSVKEQVLAIETKSTSQPRRVESEKKKSESNHNQRAKPPQSQNGSDSNLMEPISSSSGLAKDSNEARRLNQTRESNEHSSDSKKTDRPNERETSTNSNEMEENKYVTIYKTRSQKRENTQRVENDQSADKIQRLETSTDLIESKQQTETKNSGRANKNQENSAKKLDQKTEKKTLEDYKPTPKETDIKVTFEVLLPATSWNLKNGNVFIVFGPPLSDWNTKRVQMSQKVGTEALQNYVYLTGELSFPEDLKCKSIPYKYVFEELNRKVSWESFPSAATSEVNRCLVVPDGIVNSIKFDDVILDKFSAEMHRLGREAATMWMLPRPLELNNPNFDFAAALNRFHEVIKAFKSNGMKKCLGDTPVGHINPAGYYLDATMERYAKKFVNVLENNLNNSSPETVLSKAIYICLVSSSKYFQIKEYDDFRKIFNAFYNGKELLLGKSNLPQSINGDIQEDLVKCLKNLVNDFTKKDYPTWQKDLYGAGDWIFVMPFIYYWDQSGDRNWLNISKWKYQVNTRSCSLSYLEFVIDMKEVHPNIDEIFTSMLEVGEMEKVLLDDTAVLTFSPALLLTALRGILIQSSRVDTICNRLSNRFQDEIKTMKEHLSNQREYSKGDYDQIKIWENQILNFLRESSIPMTKKPSLIKLFLEIINSLLPVMTFPNIVQDLCQTICIDLSTTRMDLFQVCKNWSNFLHCFLNISADLHEKLLDKFKDFIFTVDPGECLDTFMMSDDSISSEIAELLFEQAIQVFRKEREKGFVNLLKSITGIGSNEKRKNNLLRLFERCVYDLKIQNEDCLEVVKTVTETPTIPNIMKFYPELLKHDISVPKDLKTKVLFVLGQVYTYYTLVNDGSLALGGFQVIRDQYPREHLISLCETYDQVQNKRETGHKFKEIIARRFSELDCFFEAKEDLTTFIKRENQSEEQFQEVLAEFFRDPSTTQLHCVCEIKYGKQEPVYLKLKHVSSSHLRIVRNHNKFYAKSSTFRQIRKKIIVSEDSEDEGNDDDGNELMKWKNLIRFAEVAIARFYQFIDELSTLQIKIGQVQEEFSEAHVQGRLSDELKILEQVSLMTGPRRWLQKVETSIKQLFILKKYEKAASAIHQALEVLGRKEHFQIVENILQTASGDGDFHNQQLSSISDDLIKAGDVFNQWSPKQINVLESLEKSQNLLKWLRENIKDRGDLKTFYELASISAGESDHEVDRVLHFYQAVSAYAPIILDLKVEDCTFIEFLKACGNVFASLERDPTIASKLVDSSNRNLEWVKACKEQQGSVEQSSLSLVKKINETGEFTICVPENVEQSRSKRTLDNLIQMKYIIAEESATLTLEELQELRSKLMLITAGTDGKKDVDRFNRILGLVELVTKHFIELLNEGCYLFTQWKLSVYFDPEKKVKVRSNLGHAGGGLLHGVNDVETELDQVTSFLKITLDEWSKHVYELRNANQSLNLFTTDQLITLSSELANLVHNNTSMSLQAEMLLRLLNPNANRKQLQKLIRNRIQSIPRNEDDESNGTPLQDHREDESHHELDNPFEKLESSEAYKTLREDYFDEDVALASLIECGEEDLESAIDWCYTHSNESEKVREILEAFAAKFNSGNEHIQVPDKFKQKNEFEEEFKVEENGLLSKQLKQVWDQFLKRVDSLEIKHHLSFLTLADCLEDLSSNLKENLERKFLSTLKEGVPNLVVCSEADMYTTALSIYMQDPRKPMPSLDEVLICHSDTPLEKIELICRRAFSDDTGRIFVIIHAERMNYDKGLHIENLCKTNVQNHDYRLVFMASKEKNDHSYIVTAFEKNRRQMASPPSPNKIESYLLDHLKANVGPDPDHLRIRIVKSMQSGNGKSLVASRLCNQVVPKHILTLNDSAINLESVVSDWFKKDHSISSAFHLDLTPVVRGGREDLIFSLAVLGGLEDSGGQVWLSADGHYYIIELTSIPLFCKSDTDAKDENEVIPFEDYLPSIVCVTPRETLVLLQENKGHTNEFLKTDQGMWTYLFDHTKFQSSNFQRPYMYLSLLRIPGQQAVLDACVYNDQPTNLDHLHDCLESLLRSCSIQDPTWLELTHFASFLNAQLSSSEHSFFCNPDLVKEEFPGMKTFVVKFLIQMSKDFATRSVEISDQSHGEGFSKPLIEDRHRWENSPHPYIFFNEDGHSLSFHGFKIDRHRNVIDERSGQILEHNIMSHQLYHGLVNNGVKFNKVFDEETEANKITDLCRVLGVHSAHQNPDKSYELTSDNVMKMLAIYMRFKSNIPVVIMGETGSGKTRLVRYLCDLLREGKSLENLIILKTHGGVTEENIYTMVDKAIHQAQINKQRGVKLTVLFFDEANTTNAIGAIKSVMCDRLCNGVPIPDNIGLQFVAAVNPFREHSAEMIKKLENAGLGYHIRADKTQDKLGKIPMRRLVYRVKEIPASMFPLIWDFGNLDDQTERKYIKQMIHTFLANQDFGIMPDMFVEILSRSQKFMRARQDECSFVSLRDVERLLVTLKWFHSQSEIIAKKIFQRLYPVHQANLNRINLILALGVTYYTRLDERRTDYETEIAHCLSLEADYFSLVVVACQDLFIDELKLEKNIAKNDALKENVWMMAICIELRIPLFLVGKPGSSKSLAKTVITDVMQGDMSYSKLFKHFKEIHMVSFQCSPLATAGGILSTFRQCQKFQDKRDLNRFAAVTVLDEIGLAEDSEKMPLKALHPLLEDGCVDLELPEPYKKVSFIGISNWALDPAKMNRGILLSRGVPDKRDLITSAEGICSRDKDALGLMKGCIDQLANGYYTVYGKQDREYFGLRDFYSLVKMIYAKVQDTRQEPTKEDIIHAVQRNFGGYFGKFKPTEEFLQAIYPNLDKGTFLPARTLVTEAIKQEGETRYILILTKNNAALNIIQEQNLLDMTTTTIIFGSSFIEDQEYRQICLNINRIKIAMELGHTVILCNLNNLYESLYDALNQNYITMSDSRYVDLGLGTHRVKCRIHQNFRLVLIAEDVEVYEKFPIPLINRLEKHYLGMETMLTEEIQQQLVKELKGWLSAASSVKLPPYKMEKFQQFSPKDVFIGYHEDAPASIVLRLEKDESPETILQKAKTIFLEIATPDAISRLSETMLSPEEKVSLSQTFYKIPKRSLSEAIKEYSRRHNMIQVTTFSRLLTEGAKIDICNELSLKSTGDIQILTLQQINTEEQFSKRIKAFLEMSKKHPTDKKILVVQTQVTPETSSSLVECSRYSILNEVQQLIREGHDANFCIVLVLQVPRVHGGFFAGFPGVQWKALHIDEICGDPNHLDVARWNEMTLHQVFEDLLADRKLKQLVEESIPKAASMAYKSDDLLAARITRCVEIIKKSFSGPDQRFVNIVCAKILGLIEKETRREPEKWMADLAIGSVHLKEGNTFARSIWLHLVDKVSTHLSRVIKSCDVQSGLEHLVSETPWVQTLFMELLEILELDSSDGSKATSCMTFPFSWAIEQQLFKLYQRDERDPTSLDAAFNATLLGKGLLELFCKVPSSMQSFVHDLSKLILVGEINGNLMKHVYREIYKCAKRIRIEMIRESSMETGDDNELNLSDIQVTATDIYAAVNWIKPRLQVFIDIAKLFPEVLLKIKEEENKFNVDIQAINFALEKNQTVGPTIANEETRKEWKSKVTILSTYLSQIEGYLGKNRAPIPDEDLLKSAGQKCKQAKIVMLYLDHTVDKDSHASVKEVVCGKLRLLWPALNNVDFIESPKSFDAILNCINRHCTMVEKALSAPDGIQKCIICMEEIIEPVKLPCEHVGCKECLETHIRESQSRSCPQEGCKIIVPADFNFASSIDMKVAVEIHTDFRHKLSQFFLDLLQIFVFQSGQPPPHDQIIDKLLSLIVSKTLPKDQTKPRTKRPSPFQGDFIDATPVIRSFVLQLLLRYKIESVEKYLERYLSENKFVSNIQFPEICIILIQCAEDSFLVDRADKNIFNVSSNWMKSGMERRNEPVTANSLVKSLVNAAMDRIIMRDVSLALDKFLSGQANQDEVGGFIAQAIEFFKNHRQVSNLQKYLSRLIMVKFGESFIMDWKKQGVFLELLPQELLACSSNEVQDMYLLVDPTYKRIRDAMRLAWVSGNYEELQALARETRQGTLVWRLAIHHLTCVNQVQINNLDSFGVFLQQQPPANRAWQTSENAFCIHLTNKSRRHESIRNLLIHLQEVIANNRLTHFLSVVHQLALNPNNCVQLFLPTMPQDESLEAKNAVRDAKSWYACPNGHAYAIGDCGKPNQTSRCYCGAIIGGENHLFADGGQHGEAVITDQTKRGHILGAAQTGERSKTLRGMNGLHVALTQFVLHASMMMGVQSNPGGVLAICNPRPANDDIGEFLANHLVLNFTQISQCLGKGENEVIILLHQVFARMGLGHDIRGNWILNTKDLVRSWETSFVAQYLDPVLANLNETILNHQLAVQEDQLEAANAEAANEEAANALLNIMSEPDGVVYAEEKVLDLPQLWRPRENIQVDSLEAKIGSKRLEEQCPFLAYLLKEQKAHEQLKNLPMVIELTRYCVKTFNRKFEMVELDQMTVRQFFLRHLNSKHIEGLIKAFISSFNCLKNKIFGNGWIGRKVELLLNNDDITMDTPASVIFPASHGFGLASTLLINFLVDQHNAAVTRFLPDYDETKQLTVDCQEIVDSSMLVSLDARDLHLLLIGNSEYNFEVKDAKGEAKWMINEHALENGCIEKLLNGKPTINHGSIPKFEYRLERLHTSSWTLLDSKIPQDSSPPSAAICYQLESELPEIRDISALVEVLQTTVDTLTLVGGQQSQNLYETIFRLKITSEKLSKTLEGFELRHLKPLMMHLRFARAKRMVNNNQLPFHKVDAVFLQQLPEHLMTSVNELLHHADPELFSRDLLDFIHDQIEDNKEAALENVDKSLLHFFVAFLDANDSKHVEEIKRYLAEEIEMKHAVSLFRIVASKIQDRM